MASPDAVDDGSKTNELYRTLTGTSVDVDFKDEFKGSGEEEVGVPRDSNAGIPLAYDEVAWYLKVPFVSTYAPPPQHTVENAPVLPEATASWFGIISFHWLSPLIALGYARPLEQEDLYRLQDSRSSAVIAEKILSSFERRRIRADDYNAKLLNGDISPGWRSIWWTVRGNRKEREQKWREKDGQKKPSLILAMNDSVKGWFWIGGLLKVTSDTAQITSPLVVKALVHFAQASYNAVRSDPPTEAPPISRGIGLAFTLFIMQAIASLCVHHFFYHAASTGVLLRGGLITAIYSRSLRLSSRARQTLTNGKLVNHISTDVSRIDFCCSWFHMVWAAPIQMTICLILLLINLGPSALAGYAFFVFLTPCQTEVMKRLSTIRTKSMHWTDKRVKLLQELLGGMKIIKYFAWEVPFLKRISEIRGTETKYIRSLLLIRAANNAVAVSLPGLAAILSFVVYTLAGNPLDPATIFASLTLFQLLKIPLMFLPLSFSCIVDANNASERLYHVFVAEQLSDTIVQKDDLESAIEVVHADFTWDSAPSEAEDPRSKKDEAKLNEKMAEVLGLSSEEKEHGVFQLKDVNFEIPRGSLVAIVGPVGAGKSSLLQGLIGEMRRTTGTVCFGGSVSYCPQTAWIQNATIRENVCFGRPFDEEKYWKAIRDACLEPDLDLLPHGDMTEVGEKGISLSGGQKQRLNICRAIYCDMDIQIFDDPLSALDAHVGKAVFQNVLRTSTEGKTRVLVTHALHFLPYVDYIYTMVDGRIAERGTYAELIAVEGAFATFVREFGANVEMAEDEGSGVEEEQVQRDTKPRKPSATGGAIMQAEERSTGAVSGAVYKMYLKAGNGRIMVPLLLLAMVIAQGSTVMSSYWLVYWQETKWPLPQGFYMGVYAGLGFSQALGFFLLGSSFALLTYYASTGLHQLAIKRIMNAPMSFFDTTPLGRIMNRFSKDTDTIDNILGDTLRMTAGTISQIIGAILLISILLPWFLIAVVCVSVLYYWAALFYRWSARELKRLDAILRSSMYSHFSESLSGLATIRAYGELERFKHDNEYRIDVENRAYWLTTVNQRWLGIRVDCLGIMLTFVVAILTVASRFTLSPSQTGVTLSYILTVQQSFGFLIRQTAEVENDMNSVERIVHYAESIDQEARHDIPDKKPPPEWPTTGALEFKSIVLKYRPELPAVLKGISMKVKGGEKIGIVGRTGAGKSSIMMALYRLVELTSGSMSIDGLDISRMGLTDVRKNIAIIPQDPLLFSGTLRSNLDPFGLHDDALLWDALKRSYLVEQSPSKANSVDFSQEDSSSMPANRLTLDSPIDDEGNNLSVGQRSLVSLARALVKNSKVLVLDEATASVDYETDRHIQDTIAREFTDRTILCIAHRLRTIIGYDRICVLDAGQIAEFDTPSNLFLKPDSIFRGMCDQSSITWDDIRLAIKIREAY